MPRGRRLGCWRGRHRSAECPLLCADGSIGSVRGLLRPQTKQSMQHRQSTIRGLRRARISQSRVVFLSRVSLLVAAADAMIGSSGKWADDCPRQSLSLGQSSARFPELLLRGEGRAPQFSRRPIGLLTILPSKKATRACSYNAQSAHEKKSISIN